MYLLETRLLGETLIVLQGSLLQNLFEQITFILITGWGIVILVGTIASALLVAFGFIYWFTGLDTKKGKKMAIGGIVLFFVMQWLAINPPWRVILG